MASSDSENTVVMSAAPVATVSLSDRSDIDTAACSRASDRRWGNVSAMYFWRDIAVVLELKRIQMCSLLLIADSMMVPA